MMQFFINNRLVGLFKSFARILQIDRQHVQAVSSIHDNSIFIFNSDRQIDGGIRWENAEHGMNG